jgi:hypothetical protein
MFSRLIGMGLFLAALAGTVAVAVADAGAADNPAKKTEGKKAKKKAAKKKMAPLNTDAIFKKLDVNTDSKVDLNEFKKLFSIQPEPKGKKGKELGPFDLEFTFKSLDANSDNFLSSDEFKGIVPAIYPQPKK